MTQRDIQTEDTVLLIYNIINQLKNSTLSEEEKQKLINVELGKMREFFEQDGYERFKRELELDPMNYITCKVLKTFNNQIKAKDSERMMIVDTAFLSGEYQDFNNEELIAYFEGMYGFKVFLINSNRINSEMIDYIKKPIYFI